MSLGDSFPSIIEAARIGASWALAALYEDLHPHVLTYLRSQSREEAEDLASETWVDVARGLHRFEGGEPEFRRFVFAIARRRLIDHRRLAARRRTHSVSPMDLSALAGSGDVEAEAVSNLSAEEAVARIASILPPDQAEVVLLRVVGGFSANEVAGIIGKSPGAVRVLQHRGLARLTQTLSGESVTEPWRRAM